MPLEPARALAFLSTPLPAGPWPLGPPAPESRRSRAAAEIGRLAARSGLRTFHFEHRVALEAPDGWLDPRETTEQPEWSDGVLPEPKYRAFRHDLPVASFHPGHRAKWGAHELCHALAGFAWRPDATPLFHATAARLAELAPVVLWYWLDEVGLRRCPRHDGPRFRSHCPECAALADQGSQPVDAGRAEELVADAARFVDRELAAVARTARLGVPCSHVWGSIDLCSDGIGYAAGHGRRLASRSFGAFAERFLRPEDPTWSPTLEAMEARVIAVLRAMAHGDPLALAPSPRWAAWDLGQRLLEVWEQCDEPCAAEVMQVVDALAQGGSEAEAFAAYAALFDSYELPHPDDVFAIGYDVDGVPGRLVEQVRDGLRSVVPLTLTLGEDAGVDRVPAFVAADGYERAPLGTRFARWLADTHPGPEAHLAGYEAALRTARGEPEAMALGEGDGLRLADGVEVRTFPFDVATWAEQVDAGSATMAEAPPPAPTGMAFGRDRTGDLVVAEVPVEYAADLAGAPESVTGALRELGLLVPIRWRV